MSSPAAALHSPEILPEQALLGLMLADKNARAIALAKCPIALFQDPFHRRIFECVKAAAEAGDPISPLKIRAKLKGDPAWSDFSPDYIEALRDAAPQADVNGLMDRLRSDRGATVSTPERTFFTLKSIAGLNDKVAHEYLIKGLIAPGEMSVFYGEPGSGKSFLATFLAYNLTINRSVFGRRVRGAAAVFVALEGQIGFERRLHALRDSLGPSDRFFWITQPADLHGGIGDVEGLIDAVLKADAGLLVIDTLARAMGAGSENEGRDMGAVIAAIDFIRRETGAHVAVVHHSGKDNSKGMRGHSSLLGAADMALEIKRTDTGGRTLRVVKAKDGLDGEEFGFSLDVVDLGMDDDGDMITTCLVAPGEVEPKTPAAKRIPGAAKTALSMMEKALAEAGEPAPASNHIPRTSRTIRLSVWRRYCDAGMVAESDNPDTKYKAFVRAVAKLQELGVIGVWGDFAWRS